jgi:hypothetical protein
MPRITLLRNWALVLSCTLLAAPIVSGQQSSPTGTNATVAGPTIYVQMIDTVDSSRDPAGKQYRGGLTRPVNLGNGVIILQGSPATVVLVRNGSGWNVQLSSVVIKGQVTTVTSNPGILTGAAAQSNVAAAANAANAILGRFGRKPNTYSPDGVVSMGQRVILTPGLTLSFVLSATQVLPEVNPAPAPVAQNPAAPAATAAQPPPAAAGQSVPAQGNCTPTALAQTSRSETACFYCAEGTGTVTYVTNIFQATLTSFADFVKIDDAFKKYVEQETGYKGFPTASYCHYWSGLNSKYLAQDFRERELNQARMLTRIKLVETDWTYIPQSSNETNSSQSSHTVPAEPSAPAVSASRLSPGATPAAIAVQPPAAAVAGQSVPAQQAPATFTQYLFCTGVASPQSTTYYSGVIITHERNMNPVHVAFFEFLKQQYSYKGPGEYPYDLQCYGVRSAEEARSVEQRYVNGDRQNKRNVIETGWTYRQDTPTVASAKDKPFYCFGYNDNKNVYFSDTFEVPPNYRSNTNLIILFVDFLTEKYGVSGRYGWGGGVDCSFGGKAKQDVGAGYKIVETGWKPKTLPPVWH